MNLSLKPPLRFRWSEIPLHGSILISDAGPRVPGRPSDCVQVSFGRRRGASKFHSSESTGGRPSSRPYLARAACSPADHMTTHRGVFYEERPVFIPPKRRRGVPNTLYAGTLAPTTDPLQSKSRATRLTVGTIEYWFRTTTVASIGRSQPGCLARHSIAVDFWASLKCVPRQGTAAG